MIIKKAFKIGGSFFTSKEYRTAAWSLFGSSIVMELIIVFLNVKITQWFNAFYTSLENLDKHGLSKNIIWVCILILIFIAVATSRYVLQSYLYIKWRSYLTEKYVNKWTEYKSFYGFHLIGNSNDNPDQRISEDLKSFVNYTIALTLSLLRNIVTLVSFIVMLWILSGTLKFELFGKHFELSGYLVYAAIIYSVIDTYITFKIGQNLTKKDYLQEKKEANFRFSLVRLRENAESIAMYKGEDYEKEIFKSNFSEIINNFKEIIKINRNITIWSSFTANFSTIVPILFGAPRLFAKEINFGGLMQIRLAFSQVQDAFSFFANSITTIAAYRAVIERICEFEENIERWKTELNTNKIQIEQHKSDKLQIENLNLLSPTKLALQNNLNFTFIPGKHYLISGKNGSGKSTFLKSIQGVWPFGEGKIKIPEGKSLFFIPQHEYMPLGTLAEIICYPSKNTLDEHTLINLLKEVNLEYLALRLNNNENWSVSLSLGEQQKISILRAIIYKPDILLMDECSNGIAPKDEAIIFKALKEKLPKATIITIAHQASIRDYNDEEIVFN